MDTLPEEIDARLNSLRPLIKKIDEATDRATKFVKRLEAYLADECGCRTIVETSAFDGGQEDPGTTYHLAFRHIKDRWRICIIARREGEWSVTAWDNCNREVKLAEFGRIPELVKTLDKKVKLLLDLADKIPKALGMDEGEQEKIP